MSRANEKAKTKMAAQVRTKKGKAKPSLINKLELSGDTIHSAVFILHEDSIITVASDKYVLILYCPVKLTIYNLEKIKSKKISKRSRIFFLWKNPYHASSQLKWPPVETTTAPSLDGLGYSGLATINIHINHQSINQL